MSQNLLNICQVSLARDIPIIKENYKNFKKFYRHIRIFIICPKIEVEKFKKEINFSEINIINEESLISFNEFNDLFENLSSKINYKNKFKDRLKWYYQQILKISFVIRFLNQSERNIIIWDSDTIIIKKLNFFSKNSSINYGTFNEFHKEYYHTNNKILNTLPKYYISFLNQFISITSKEASFLKEKLFKNTEIEKKKLPFKLSELVLKSIFTAHKMYNGSLFSEYELIGQTNYLQNNSKQKQILTLRSGLNGKLNHLQTSLVKFLNFKHITYEHSHPNEQSLGMLKRVQTWPGLVKIISKCLFKFYLRSIKHYYLYKKNYN